MDAIKKKMQSMKVEKDAALDRADVCEQVTFKQIKVFRDSFSWNYSNNEKIDDQSQASKAARLHADKALEEVDELVKKSQQLEVTFVNSLCEDYVASGGAGQGPGGADNDFAEVGGEGESSLWS